MRKGQQPRTLAQAMDQLESVVRTTKPEGYTPTVVRRTDDYLAVEYESPLLGFVDDVEFYLLPPEKGSRVEYRSASRVGDSDFDANRKRIKALREALQPLGWRSVGY